jgi:hypothetical protein
LGNYVARSNLGLTTAYPVLVVLVVIRNFSEYLCGAFTCVTTYPTAICSNDVRIICDSDRPIDNEFNEELTFALSLSHFTIKIKKYVLFGVVRIGIKIFYNEQAVIRKRTTAA